MKVWSHGFEQRVLLEEERVWLAARAAGVARYAGFDTAMQARVSLCVAELVSNAARHAGGGSLRVAIVSLHPPILEVIIEDNGPGIPSHDKAILDGYSRGRLLAPDDPPQARRSLGTGLGAVARLSSQFRVVSRSGGGTRIELRFETEPKVRGAGHDKE